MDKQKIATTLWAIVEDLRGHADIYTYTVMAL